MTSDADQKAFEDVLADYPRDMHLDGVYAVAEYFWLAARNHYTAKLRELAEAAMACEASAWLSNSKQAANAKQRLVSLAAAILSEQEQDDA